MYGTDSVTDESERTAFRRPEKKNTNFITIKNSNLPKKSFNRNGKLPPGVLLVEREFDLPVLCLEKRPGFYFFPGELNVEQQCQWTRESLTCFPQPPNRANHSAIYGPIQDLFVAGNERKILVEEKSLL